MNLQRLIHNGTSEPWLALCGSQRWAEEMVEAMPVQDRDEVHRVADRAFQTLSPDDWHAAFEAHPMIGDLKSLRMKYAGNRQWSEGEQSSMKVASDDVIDRLAKGNQEYLHRFGYIFIICATGKTADEILVALESRLCHQANLERSIAAAEQVKITHLRIDKLPL